LRFAVHGPGIPEASPRSHGVPRRDVPGRVHISIADVPAGRAPEDGLALARPPVHQPARRTPLARERWLDPFHPAWRFLLDARAAARAVPRAGQPSLQPPPPRALGPGQARGVQQFPGRQGGGDRHAPVNARNLAIARRRDWFGDGGKSHMPAPGAIPGHTIGLHPRRNRPRPAKTHPSGLRHPYLTDVAGHPPHVPLPATPPHNPETFVPPSLAPGRLARRVARVEKRAHGLGEVPERLLLHRLAAGGQPRMLRPDRSELPTLFQVARRAPSASAPVPVLLDGQVPDIPRVSTVFAQHRLLGGGWLQPEPRHTNKLSSGTDNPEEVKPG